MQGISLRNVLAGCGLAVVSALSLPLSGVAEEIHPVESAASDIQSRTFGLQNMNVPPSPATQLLTSQTTDSGYTAQTSRQISTLQSNSAEDCDRKPERGKATAPVLSRFMRRTLASSTLQCPDSLHQDVVLVQEPRP